MSGDWNSTGSTWRPKARRCTLRCRPCGNCCGRTGFTSRLPHFLGQIANALIGAASLSVAGVMFWLMTFIARRGPAPWSLAMWVVLGCGLLGLIGHPIYYRRMAERHGLMRWSTFKGVRQRR